MKLPLRILLDHASDNNYALPAFNVITLEHVHALFQTANKLEAPLLIAFSRSARKVMNDTFIRSICDAAEQEYPNVPFAIHQDHGNSFATCATALNNGFTSVMMDGSLNEDGKTPSSYEYNSEVTKKVVDLAHSLGASVEGELGVLGSLETGKGDQEDGHGADMELSNEQLLTDPQQAADFVKYTNVDCLAVAIGTSHGAYKFTHRPRGDILAIDRIKKISQATGGTPLVMHGSSSVPQELQDMLNQFGGEIKQTYGVPIEEIQEGIKNGVRKVNIDTDLRMAFTAEIRKFFIENPSEFDIKKYMLLAREGLMKIAHNRMEKFYCTGQANTIKPQSLNKFISFYED